MSRSRKDPSRSSASLTAVQRRALVPALSIAMCAALTIEVFAATSGALAARWNIALAQTGLFTVAGTLGWAVGQVFAGRPFAAAARLTSALALLGAAGLTAASLAMESYGVALALRVMAGLGAGIAFAGSRMVLRSVAEGAALARLMSINNTIFLTVLAGAPVLGAVLAREAGPGAVAALHGCATFLALASLPLLAPRLDLDAATSARGAHSSGLSLPASFIALSCTAFTVGHGMAFAAPAILAGGGSDAFAGVVLAAMTAAAIVSQIANAHLVCRHDLVRTTRGILLAAVLVLLGAAVFLGDGAALTGVLAALVVGRTLTTMAGTNIEAMALSHPARSLDVLARRRGGAILAAGAASAAIGLGFPESPATWVALAPILGATLLALLVTVPVMPRAGSRARSTCSWR